MFDYISVADKLPVNDEMIRLGLDKNVFQFQTKDLDCSISEYFIQGGKLFEQKYKETKWVENKDALFYGHIDRTEPYLEDIKYHGTLNFYHSEAVDNLDCWMEYNAIFTHGALENIELVLVRVTDNTDSRNRLKEIFAQADLSRKKWYNKYLFHTELWRKINRLIYSILNGIENIIYKIKMRIP